MPKDFWMPACAMSGQGHALVGCNVAGPDAYVQIAVAMRYADDPLGTIRAPAIAHASNAPYNFDDGTGFFEPGPRFSKHLSARFVPEDVLIEDVVIRDPKHLTLRVRVSPDSLKGPKLLTITNPDGQSTSASEMFIVEGLIRVEIGRVESGLRLSWARSARDYVLQSRGLDASAPWNSVGIPPTDDGEQLSVVVEAVAPGEFFRLVR